MKLIWGEDYEALAEVARAVFAKLSPLEHRAIAPTFREQLTQLVELDWLALGNPLGIDDDEPGIATIAAVYVEAGRALAPTPLPAISLARDVLLASANADVADVTSALELGKLVVMPALYDAAWGKTAPRFADGALTGTAFAVPHAAEADRFVVEAVSDRGEAVLLLVDVNDALTIDHLPNLGNHPLAAVSFGGGTTARVIAMGAAAENAMGLARQRASVLTAALIHGAGTSLQAMTVQYAKDRHQYGVPIGQFQAVQYLCTDIAIGVHLVSALAREAARVIDCGENAELAVALLSMQAQTAAQEMVHAAHEVHAGIGYMRESNVHLYTEVTRQWAFSLGRPSTLEHRVVAQLRAGEAVR